MTRRRPYGTGSLQQRSAGSFRIRVQLGTDPLTGKPRRHEETVRGTRRDAERRLRELQTQRDHGFDIAPERMTVGDWASRWLRDYAGQRVVRSTLVRYEMVLRKHVVSVIGELRLGDVRAHHIRTVHSRARTAGLSARTIVQHHRVIRQMFQHALQADLISRNPADAVRPPRPERYQARALRPDEISTLLEASKGEAVEPLIRVALATGAREGELLALRWQNVDLEAGVLRIVENAHFFKGEGVVISQPKTARSRRAIRLSRTAVRVLREHRRDQMLRRLRAGVLWQDHDLVFPSRIGTPWEARNMYRAFQVIVTKTALGRLTFHDLRHTAATLMLEARVGMKEVSERLGHASVAFTMDTYAHVQPASELSAAEAMDAYIG